MYHRDAKRTGRSQAKPDHGLAGSLKSRYGAFPQIFIKAFLRRIQQQFQLSVRLVLLRSGLAIDFQACVKTFYPCWWLL